jgi:ABC-type transporter Mla subunit MlaD
MPEDGDLAEQSAAVVVACSKGQIPPDIATMLCQSLLSIAQLQDKRLVETIEELQRLLDEQHSGKTQ